MNIVIHADRKVNNTKHWGHYNAPTMNKVVVVVVNQECDKDKIVIRSRDNRLH